MTNTSLRNPRGKSLWKALFAGLVAGAVATAAKSAAERLYPPRVHGEPEPPELLAGRMVGQHFGPTSPSVVPSVATSGAAQGIHWGFGVGAGAAYGAVAEYFPAATAKGGASFGLVLMTLTHEGALPALGLAAAPEHQAAREHRSEAATHILYGVVAERVRRWVRGRLG